MYARPLHHLFELGYKLEEFPRARLFAEQVLTLPVHPFVTEQDLEVTIKTIKESV
jgi:dTDP-4-amino-4,6-dideoxygalactose transaminase